MSDDLVKQITVYLSNGGLFNPEMMDHDKVRNLLMDCRDRIEKLEALVERLRDDNSFLIDDNDKTFLHQESRIEKLEAALREVATCTSEHGGAGRALTIIRAALAEEKKDD